jgi:hypothetical protein
MRPILASLLVLSAAPVVRADPWRTETVFDGDDAATQFELASDGTLQIRGKATTTLRLGGPIARGEVRTAHVRNVPVVIVDVTTATTHEAFILERGSGGWSQLTRVDVGSASLDRDYGYEVMATDDGIYKVQTRPGIARCDGQPAYLFAEGFNRATGKFQKVARVPTLVPETAPVIGARADAGTPGGPIVFQARAASHEPGAPDAGGLGIPNELDDGRPLTFWHEEFVKSDGEGQFFTFESRASGAKAAQLRVVPGNAQSASTWRSFNRPHRLAVVAKQGAWHVDLPDAANDPVGTAYVADLPARIDGCLTVVLESTYGPANGTTAISELEVFAEGERTAGGDALLAAAIAEGNDPQRAGQELARRGATGVAALEDELAKTTDREVRHRLVRAVLAIDDPAAGPLLARVVAQGWVASSELGDAIHALAAQRQTTALRDLAMKEDVAQATRIAAVHALAVQPEIAIELAGIGKRDLRHAVIEVVTSVPLPTLLRAAQTASAPAAAGDLWRAVTRRAHADTNARPVALAALVEALATATDYERRYRVIDGIAAIGDAPALAALAQLLAHLPANAQRAAFEQTAARAIAVNPRPEGLALLVAFSRDPDPGVRLAALDALAGANSGAAEPWHAPDGPDGIDGLIDAALATDHWPEVRRRAAQVLGGRCGRGGPARTLANAVERDADFGVRGEALAALVECRAAGIADQLARVWDDRKAPLELRQRAVDLSVPLGDRALAAKLVGRFSSWRGAALESQEALALAQDAAYAIGRLAPPGAAAALTAGLDDAGFPEIVAASATGLGLMGRACPADARVRLQQLAHNDDQQVSAAAARAAAICGK